MQTNRFFEIIYYLMEHGGATAAELAQRFEVSQRTIYRDVDVLSGAGIPVYSNRGKGGGIRLLPDFVLDKSLLSGREQNEILFALQSMQATNAEGADEVLARLNSLFRKSGENWIDVDFSHWGSRGQEREKFGMLKSGILERRVVSFVYYSSYGERTLRCVEPLKLRFKSGGWYLQGFCREKCDYRIFKVCRMEEVLLTGEYFERREEPPPLETSTPDTRCGVALKLRFESSAAYRLFDEFDRDQIQQEGDCFLITQFLPVDDWLYGYLLSFGDALEVLAPGWVRLGLRERAERIAARYGNT